MLGQNQRKPHKQAICAPFDIPLRPRLRAGLRPPFGSGLRCCGASPYGPLRRAFGQGCARPSAWLRSAYSPRPAPGRAVSGGLCPPLPGPLASHSLSLGFGFCGMRGGCGPRPVSAPGFGPGLAGDRPRLRLGSGPAPGIAPLPYCESVPSGRVRAAPGARGKQPPRLYSPPRSRPQGSFGPPSAALRGLAPCPGVGSVASRRVPPGLLFSVVGPAGRFVPGASARGGPGGRGPGRARSRASWRVRSPPGPLRRGRGLSFAAAAGFCRDRAAPGPGPPAFSLKGGSYIRYAPSRREFVTALLLSFALVFIELLFVQGD